MRRRRLLTTSIFVRLRVDNGRANNSHTSSLGGTSQRVSELDVTAANERLLTFAGDLAAAQITFADNIFVVCAVPDPTSRGVI
jgi:hypothetical protein